MRLTSFTAFTALGSLGSLGSLSEDFSTFGFAESDLLASVFFTVGFFDDSASLETGEVCFFFGSVSTVFFPVAAGFTTDEGRSDVVFFAGDAVNAAVVRAGALRAAGLRVTGLRFAVVEVELFTIADFSVGADFAAGVDSFFGATDFVVAEGCDVDFTDDFLDGVDTAEGRAVVPFFPAPESDLVPVSVTASSEGSGAGITLLTYQGHPPYSSLDPVF